MARRDTNLYADAVGVSAPLMLLGLFYGDPAADHILAERPELFRFFTDQLFEGLCLFYFPVCNF
jgi:hypothetical protein